MAKGVQEIKRGESYRISFQIDGNRIFKRIKAGSIREAESKKNELMADYKPAEVNSTLSFEELKEQLIRQCKADGNCEKTIRNILSKYTHFFEEFLPEEYSHITRLNQITKPVIESFKRYWSVDRGGIKGLRGELTRLRVIFSKLIALGLCERKVYYEALLPVKKPKANKRAYNPITPTQKKQLLDYIKKNRPDYYGISYIIIRFGWRRGQVISIKRQNVRMNGLRPIEIICEPQDTKTKEPHHLKDIDDELAKVLRPYLFPKKKSIWLFPNRNSRKHHADHYTAYLKKTSEKVLGRSISPHFFRHAFISEMKGRGHSDRDIMAITGHKDIGSFQIYQHATSEGTKEVLKRSKLF